MFACSDDGFLHDQLRDRAYKLVKFGVSFGFDKLNGQVFLEIDDHFNFVHSLQIKISAHKGESTILLRLSLNFKFESCTTLQFELLFDIICDRIEQIGHVVKDIQLIVVQNEHVVQLHLDLKSWAVHPAHSYFRNRFIALQQKLSNSVHGLDMMSYPEPLCPVVDKQFFILRDDWPNSSDEDFNQSHLGFGVLRFYCEGVCSNLNFYRNFVPIALRKARLVRNLAYLHDQIFNNSTTIFNSLIRTIRKWRENINATKFHQNQFLICRIPDPQIFAFF